jgi:hypothetical protein
MLLPAAAFKRFTTSTPFSTTRLNTSNAGTTNAVNRAAGSHCHAAPFTLP